MQGPTQSIYRSVPFFLPLTLFPSIFGAAICFKTSRKTRTNLGTKSYDLLFLFIREHSWNSKPIRLPVAPPCMRLVAVSKY